MTHAEEKTKAALDALGKLVKCINETIPMMLEDTQEWRKFIENNLQIFPKLSESMKIEMANIPERLRQLEGLCVKAEEHVTQARTIGIIPADIAEKSLKKVRKHRDDVLEEFKRITLMLPAGGTA